MPHPPEIWIRAPHWRQMQRDVAARAPQEACGLVAGLNNESVAVFPVENILHSRTRYQLEPKEQIRIFFLLEEQGWELLAIYHSHPDGLSRPSRTDITEAAFDEAVHLIWSQRGNAWRCRGFRIVEGSASEVGVRIGEKDA